MNESVTKNALGYLTYIDSLNPLWLQSDGDSERALVAALDAAREASDVQPLLGQLRFVFPKWRLPFIFEQLDSTLTALGKESAELLTLRLRLRIALRDFDGFLKLFERSSAYFQSGARAVSERTESVGGFSNRLVSD